MAAQSLHEVIGEAPPAGGLQSLRAFTVCVGKRETYADLYVNEVKVKSELIEVKVLIIMLVLQL